MDRSARSRLATLALVAIASLTACSSGGSSNADHLVGTYASPEGKPLVSSVTDVKRSDGSVALDIVQRKSDSQQVIALYNVEHTQTMHLVAVNDDFTEFQHVHPMLDAKTGHFTQTLEVDPTRRYYVYADTEPTGLGKQVFRFTLQPSAGATSASRPISSSPSPAKTTASPYTVSLSKTTLHAKTPQEIDVAIDRAGKPATDLRPYLGAAAHVVLLNTSTLVYAHVHPMLAGATHSMKAMSEMEMANEKPEAGPRMMMHLDALPAGTYKMWLQFQGGPTVYTVPLTLVAR